MSTPNPPINKEAKTELTKEELERKKIELEIKDLERPFWKRPVYVLAALPTLLAVGTLSVGLFNGYFSASLTKLDNQKHDVEAQIKDFEAKRDELHTENERLKTEKASVEQKIAELGKTFSVKVEGLEQKRSDLERHNNDLSAQTNDLTQQRKELEHRVGRMQEDFAAVYAYTQTLLNIASRLEANRPPVSFRPSDKTSNPAVDWVREFRNILDRTSLRKLAAILERMKKERGK